MTRLLRLAFIAAASLSCTGPNPDADGGPILPAGGDGKTAGDGTIAERKKELTSGSRLKAKYVKGEDGSEVAIGLFDSKLGVDCVFGVSEDGRQRCLPSPLAETTTDFGSFITQYKANVFLDASCAQQVALSALCDDPVKYVRLQDNCSRPRIAPISELAAQPKLIYIGYSTFCMGPYGPTPLLQKRFYSIGVPMDPSEFVAGTTTLQ